ncbi:MAG: UMP kinase [Bacilli bacterium]|nr:UMP kinase [Bacilli bacterium]
MKTILIKLSGESLAGSNSEKRGIDDNYVEYISKRIKNAQDLGARIGIVCGGGNFMRGGRTSKVIAREVADYMGMLGTVMNALALYDGLTRVGAKAYIQSGLDVASPYVNKLNSKEAMDALNDGKIVVFGGGTGKPGCSTDTAAAGRAKDIEADAIVKLTNVDGVYDKDPDEYEDAVMYDEVTFDTVLEKELGIMDLSAIEMCRDNNIEIIVTNIDNETALEDIIRGKKVGTRVYK